MRDWESDENQRPPLSERAWQQISFALDLSPRETQVARGIWHGQHNAAIAAELRVSPGTVHAYLNRIYLKLHVHNRRELVWAIADARRRLAWGCPPPEDTEHPEVPCAVHEWARRREGDGEKRERGEKGRRRQGGRGDSCVGMAP